MPHDTLTVLLPVDRVVRELDSKLVLGTALAARGLRAIVGQKAALAAIGRNSTQVIWQGIKVIANSKPYASKSHLADHLLRRGSAIMYLHDEGGMFQGYSWKEQVIGKHQLEALRPRQVQRICAWGSRQKEVMAEYAPELGHRVRVTGTPRFDLCTPRFDWIAADDVRALRSRYGGFILACTRFGSIAGKKGLHHAFEVRLDMQGWPSGLTPDEVGDLWLTKWRWDVHDFAEFVVLITELSTAYPHRQIVVRPHPSEDTRFYESAFTACRNVSVVNDGSVLNWIRACDLVVHSNCTTGIEAILASKPVLNFLPGTAERTGLDVEVASEAGVATHSIPDALAAAERLMGTTRPQHAWSPHAQSILNNLVSDAIPMLVDDTLAVAREAGIESSRLVSPMDAVRQRLGDAWNAVTTGRRRKAGQFVAEHVEMIVDGCRTNGLGAGRITHLTPHHVVIEPS